MRVALWVLRKRVVAQQVLGVQILAVWEQPVGMALQSSMLWMRIVMFF
jgi:hypothetical protein